MRDDNYLLKIIHELMKYYKVEPSEFVATQSLRDSMHSLGVLISIVLSQNTSDKNAIKALNNLRRVYGDKLEPSKLKKASIKEIEELIKPSGMYRIKARTIMRLISRFSDNDDLDRLDPEDLRRELLSIPGVGQKTVDVFLLMYRKHPTFPIDTHIRRVLSRIGFTSAQDRYEVIREKVMKAIPPELYLPAHLILIKHGRTICKARKPLCSKCPILTMCRYGLSRAKADDEG